MTERVVCTSSELVERSQGVRFELQRGAEILAAFVIRYNGRVHGWVNRCPHQGMELDWNPGEFFDCDKEYLVCASHGALFRPDSGECIGSPCTGSGLERVSVYEDSGMIYLKPES